MKKTQTKHISMLHSKRPDLFFSFLKCDDVSFLRDKSTQLRQIYKRLKSIRKDVVIKSRHRKCFDSS